MRTPGDMVDFANLKARRNMNRLGSINGVTYNEAEDVSSKLVAVSPPLTKRGASDRHVVSCVLHRHQIARQFSDPGVADLWLPLDCPAWEGFPAVPIGARRPLPGSTPGTAVPGPAVHLELRFITMEDMWRHSGPLLYTPLHWSVVRVCAALAHCVTGGC